MKPLVGFYCHYHGFGHRQRTTAIVNELDSDAVVLTSRVDSQDWSALRSDVEVIDLPCDIDDVPKVANGTEDKVRSLHYAPLWTPTIRARVAIFLRWLEETKPAVVVVDVSVEIALLCRLASTPIFVMRQHGDRRDLAHAAAYDAASTLLAPFPEVLEDAITPDEVAAKTIYASVCRRRIPLGDRASLRSELGWSNTLHGVIVLGRGGSGISTESIQALIKSGAQYQWHLVGELEPAVAQTVTDSGLTLHGWVNEPAKYLAAADLVVASAGHNTVMELAAYRCRSILIAEERPFLEQQRKCYVLERESLAATSVVWPTDNTWRSLIDRAEQIDPESWAAVVPENDSGAATLARSIDDFARQSMNHWSAGHD